MTSACDLGAKLRDTMKLYPEYNFDEFKDRRMEDTWYIENLPLARREELYDQIRQANADTDQEIGKVVLEALREKGHLESVKEVAGRVQRFKQKLLGYLSKTDKKIAIVGHSNMIKTLTATGYKEDGAPINGIDMKNCEVQFINLVMDSLGKVDPPKTVWCG